MNFQITQQHQTTYKLGEKIKFDNKINHLGYTSYIDRINNILSMFDDAFVKDLTETFNYPIYDCKKIKGLNISFWNEYTPSVFEATFDGIYKLDKLKTFIGLMPLKNQLEIKEKIEILQQSKSFSLIKHDQDKLENLVVLAPMNNFAIESNIKAIDPIVFLYVRTLKNNHILIPLTQWI
jgi:hypothetical protein